ncbi:MAG: sugar ABC transporter ATP-binding protein, partial [Mesorhizobium sp.]
MDGAVPLFRMEGISKRYGGVRALEKAELSVTPGSIHAILGENGAGKSTLIKVIAGVEQPTLGRILLEGEEVSFSSSGDAVNRGIGMVFQELNLFGNL